LSRSRRSGCALFTFVAGHFPPSTRRSATTFIQVIVSAVDTSLRVPPAKAVNPTRWTGWRVQPWQDAYRPRPTPEPIARMLVHDATSTLPPGRGAVPPGDVPPGD